MRNILDKLPKAEHTEAVLRLRAIYLASSFDAAERLARFERFQRVQSSRLADRKTLLSDWKQADYTQAAECLQAALPRLLTFHEFPTPPTPPLLSPRPTVRLRTDAAKRFRSSKSGTHLVFKVLQSCEQRWSRISHPEKLMEVKLPINHP